MEEELIDNIVDDIMNTPSGEMEETIREILTNHLSNKVIIDKDKFDSRMETRKLLSDNNLVISVKIDDLIEKWKGLKKTQHIPILNPYDEVILDLTDLLDNQEDE